SSQASGPASSDETGGIADQVEAWVLSSSSAGAVASKWPAISGWCAGAPSASGLARRVSLLRDDQTAHGDHRQHHQRRFTCTAHAVLLLHSSERWSHFRSRLADVLTRCRW